MKFDKELLKKLNILFVENDENIRELFSETLDKLFKKVFLVSTALEALTILDKNKNCDDKFWYTKI